MNHIRVMGLITVLLAAAAAAYAQSGTSYLPLEVGNRWAYTSSEVGPDIKEIVAGPSAENGESYVIRYIVSDHSPDLENDWSSNPDGDVLLHGFRRPTSGASYYYDPPLTWVDAPLFPGKTWVNVSNLLLAPGGEPVGMYAVRYTVTESQTVIVDGVPVEAHGVLEEEVDKSGGDVGTRWTSDGLPMGGAKGEVIVPHWWAQGIGEIQYRSQGIFRLTGYFLGSVSNENSTWSDLKKLYR